jgi:hypothetical protein
VQQALALVINDYVGFPSGEAFQKAFIHRQHVSGFNAERDITSILYQCCATERLEIALQVRKFGF